MIPLLPFFERLGDENDSRCTHPFACIRTSAILGLTFTVRPLKILTELL
jgi:hypothetical protein